MSQPLSTPQHPEAHFRAVGIGVGGVGAVGLPEQVGTGAGTTSAGVNPAVNPAVSAEAILNDIFKPKFTDVSIEQLRRAQQMFAVERDWDQFHTPRNLVLALVGEVGELAEIFQWKGDNVARNLPSFTAAERTHVGEEVSDILLYLIRLADICGIDLGHAVLEKLQKNASKYPVETCKGSSAKYTQLQQAPLSVKKERLKLEDRAASASGEHPDAKRKRFTEEQIEALTEVAEQANWSLLSLSQEERDAICREYGITKERLQNFFNNRKPKELKKPKPTKNPDGGPQLGQEHSQDGFGQVALQVHGQPGQQQLLPHPGLPLSGYQ